MAAGLDAITLLRDLPAEERQALARRCAWRRFAADALIISQESSSRDILFIVEGRVRVIDPTLLGREVSFAEIEAGGHVGELAAIDGGPRSANVVAVVDCFIASLPVADFRALLLRHAPIAVALLEDLAHIIRLADVRISELSTLGAVARICRELLRRAADKPGSPGRRVVQPLPTQEELASATGTTRETVGRVLSRLSRGGVVRRQGRTLELLEPQSLATLAGDIAGNAGDGAPESSP